MSTSIAAANAPESSEASPHAVAVPKVSIMRRVIMVVLVLGGLACLWYWWTNRAKTEAMTGDGGEDKPATIIGALTTVVGGILGFNRSGDPVMAKRPDAPKALKAAAPAPPQDLDAMVKLAARAKAAGLKLQGVSQCKWTQYQREMFGDHGDESRKVLESIYTECRSSEMCPNIKGYPTWVHGDRQYPGYKSLAALTALVSEVEQQQPIPSLQGPAEPLVENIPDAVPSLKSGTEPMDPDMMYEVVKRMLSKKEADDAAKAEAAKEQSADPGQTGEKTAPEPATNETQGGFARGSSGGAAPGTKENVRGVSFHAPLAVPNLPGTAPFHLDISHADNQNRQGNVPRASNDNPLSTPGLAHQLIETFNQAETRKATRSKDAQVLSKALFPHSVDITTGDAFDSKAIHYAKNN